ncbi:MAG: hypothetical protein IPI17_12520 [Nitrosomonas sp.]|nr:hypothetical protein [Nitrosomonas sp.]
MMTSFLLVKGLRIAMMYQGVNVEGLEAYERAVRLVFEQQKEHESQWMAIKSIASKIGCTAETLRTWVRRTEIDQEFEAACRVRIVSGSRNWNRRIRELKRANEILRKASAYFAQAELDRRPK